MKWFVSEEQGISLRDQVLFFLVFYTLRKVQSIHTVEKGISEFR